MSKKVTWKARRKGTNFKRAKTKKTKMMKPDSSFHFGLSSAFDGSILLQVPPLEVVTTHSPSICMSNSFSLSRSLLCRSWGLTLTLTSSLPLSLCTSLCLLIVVLVSWTSFDFCHSHLRRSLESLLLLSSSSLEPNCIEVALTDALNFLPDSAKWWRRVRLLVLQVAIEDAVVPSAAA